MEFNVSLLKLQEIKNNYHPKGNSISLSELEETKGSFEWKNGNTDGEVVFIPKT